MFVDQKTEEVFVPLNDTLNTGRLELANSELFEFYLGSLDADPCKGSLSELAVLGVSREYLVTFLRLPLTSFSLSTV